MNETNVLPPIEEKPEADYDEFQRLSIKLGIPVPMVHISLDVSKDGKDISHHQQRSRTWNRNFWNFILCFVTTTPGVATNFGAGYLSFKATSGSVPALNMPSAYFSSIAPINDSTYGILVGIGTAAESFEGYALATQCTHGSGGNQLIHAAHSAMVQAYVAGTKTWTITIKRIYNNNSGSTIVIAETALVLRWPGGAVSFMLNRDLLASTQNVANGAQLTVSYDVSLVFPA